MGRLEGKVALISGGAQGQGAAEGRVFAREGARVVLADVQVDKAEAVAASIGDSARAVALDVRDGGEWQRAVATAVDGFGRLDVLVNNAGIGFPPRLLDDVPWAEYRQVLDVNLDGVFLGIRAALPALRAGGGGSIVNISSIDGLVGVAGMAGYTASKFGVTGLTRVAALELGRHGVRVNSIHPGVIDTEMFQQAPADIQDRFHRLMAHQPISRLGTPEEVAYLALFLASDESSYCTGAQFVVDGGHLAGPYREGLFD
jgi:3alpha(or 20beta)-hydroxysteroid dehydrogenase